LTCIDIAFPYEINEQAAEPEIQFNYDRALNSYSRDTREGFYNPYLLMHCRHLERLILKNVTWFVSGSDHELEPLPQEIIIKMVRYHPTLRWLQSDLTEENVAILKQEARPEITFVAN
jgi:hypothetical protein